MSPAGPCTAGTAAGAGLLRSFSAAAVVLTAANRAARKQGLACRRAGYQYFVAVQDEPSAHARGACLPRSCATALPADVQAAAGLVLDVPKLVHVEAYTDFGPPVAALPPSGPLLPGGPPDGQYNETAWLAVDFRGLCLGQLALPAAYWQAPYLALSFREFRGGSADYAHAVYATLTCFLSTRMMLGPGVIDLTLLVAGTYHWNYPLSSTVRIRAVKNAQPCGMRNWLENTPEARLGIEVALPPMWRIWAPDPGAVRGWLVKRYALPAWNGLHAMHVCSMPLDSGLRWTVPADALPAALTLAARGPCSAAVASYLPELTAASAAFFGNGTSWSEVSAKAIRCVETLEGSFWEVHLHADAWLLGALAGDASGPGSPAARARRQRARVRELQRLHGLLGSDSLVAYLCLPSRFELEAMLESVGGIPPTSQCDDRALPQAMPLMLAYMTGLYEEFSKAPVPSELTVRFGERATSAYSVQLTHYHALAVQERKAQKDLQHVAAADGQLSAAVCVLGLARTLSSPTVFRSLAENATGMAALGAEVSNFFVLDLGGRPLSDFLEAFEHVPPAALALVNGTSWGEPKPCPEFERCGAACLLQFHKLGICLELIRTAEVQRGSSFDWLVRLRPDMVFHAPIGHLGDLDASAVHAVFRASGMSDLNDHFALVPRAHAEAYFGIGESCPTEFEVRYSPCLGDLEYGGHIYPECALKARLQRLGVELVAFPKIFMILRADFCVQTQEMWAGLTKTDACGTTGN